MDIILNKYKRNENIFAQPVLEPNPKEDTNFKQNKFSDSEKNKNEHANVNVVETSRINDLDSNILESFAYKDLDNDVFKYECNINRLENKLANINSEINTLESVNSNIQLSDLKLKRDLIISKLEKLYEEYENISVSTSMSSKLTEFMNRCKQQDYITSSIAYLFKTAMSKISKKYKYSSMVKDSLKTLNKINTSVDELIKMRSPYGEVDLKYEKLTAFLNKANYLHAKIISNKK